MTRTNPGRPRFEFPDLLGFAAGVELIAATKSVDPATMISGYRRGLFPMPLDHRLYGWWSPNPRGVLPLSQLRVTRSLRKSAKRFTVTVDESFDEVLRACADPDRAGSWIDDELMDCYRWLHRNGWAHSVEVRSAGALVGGLYGVEVGGLFAGESMFHRATDASKVALTALVEHLAAEGGPRLLDTQWRTDHLTSLGVIDVPRGDYLRLLASVLSTPPAFG